MVKGFNYISLQIYSHYPSLDTVLDGGSAGQPEAKWVGIAVSATAPPTVVRAYYNQGLQVSVG